MYVVVGDRDAGNARSVWAYDSNGVLQWSYDTGGNTTCIATDGKGFIYVGGEVSGAKNVWKLNLAGVLQTSIYHNGVGTVYTIYATTKYIYITGNGASRYSLDLTIEEEIQPSGNIFEAIVADTSGNIYIGAGGIPQNLFKYNSSLVLQFMEDPQTTKNNNSIKLLSNGNPVSCIDNDVYEHASDGTSPDAGEWSTAVGTLGSFVRCDIDILTDTIYVVSYNNAIGVYERFTVLNSSGTRQWGISTANGDLEDVIYGKDGVITVVGDTVDGYSIWTVDTTTQTLTGVADTTTNLKGIICVSFASYDRTYSRKLVAIGGNEVWYESIPGIMSEVTDATGDVNCSNTLATATAWQKVFIANGDKLKVLDFANVKIATTDITLSAANVIPLKGDVLTGGTSGAEMIVDYIDATDGACNVFGYRTTTASFLSTDTSVTGSNDNGDIEFALDATAETAGPHWYDWTPYSNDTTTYGEMPGAASIVARYRGKMILAGHPSYPHQWYMSKTADPFNWLYSTNDPLTAVAGQNAMAGEIGDIIRALISYNDDYMVVGCVSSIHLITGDPAYGGSIDELSNNVGIAGPNAWCKDHDGNLYFFGTGGIYKMDGGRSRPQNISSGVLPKLISDWAYNPEGEKITLTFDPIRMGIVISKTINASGDNLNYWYSLLTNGFYPETYPTECGIFSSVYYDSDVSNYRSTLYGCNDGYIRYFLDTSKDDNIGTTDEAISSYMTLPAFPIGDGYDVEGKILQIVFVTSGGATGGTYSDSDGFSYDVHVAEDAETCIEYVIDGATAALTGTVSGTGRTSRIRQKIRGQYGTIKLYNNTKTETFAINKVLVDKQIIGRLKD